MSERKVLNKYYPPDFDPSLIPRRSGSKIAQHKVRLMAPFSMQCTTCGEYIYKGKKFNARKETVKGETYLTIKIFRFYIRCPRCSAELTFKTDPKNTDYVAENGVTRNFEPWRDVSKENEDAREERERDELNSPLKALENRTLDSKREMEIADKLDEIRTRNARNERIDAEDILLQLDSEDDHQSTDEDEMEAKRVFELKRKRELKELERKTKTNILDEPLEDEEEEEVSIDRVIQTKDQNAMWSVKKDTVSKQSTGNPFGIVKKAKTTSNTSESKANPDPVNITSLLGDYGSSSEDE